MKTAKHAGLLISLAWVLVLLGSLEGVTQAHRVYFKQRMRIPYAMQSGSKVIEAGTYLVTIKAERGQRILTLQSARGHLVLRKPGREEKIPPKEKPNPKSETQLNIFQELDAKSGKRWITFHLTIRHPVFRQKVFRLAFRVPAAVETAN